MQAISFSPSWWYIQGATVERSEMKRAWPQKAKYTAINAFLIFHIVAIACWSLPIDTPLIPLCRNIVRPYFLWIGLFQSWDMFAPNPKAANTYMEAEVIYKDGSITTWAFPRMNQLSLSERYLKEHYRKFEDNLTREDTDDLLPDAARYIARLTGTEKPAKTVILIQNLSFIVPRADGSYSPEPWDEHVLLGYGVRPEDLK
ncbi:MAG: hypothetical protein ACRD3Q_12045 [Terriglobales bacterium]